MMLSLGWRKFLLLACAGSLISPFLAQAESPASQPSVTPAEVTKTAGSDADALLATAEHYRHGDGGFVQSDILAAQFYQKAADLGSGPAMLALGYAYAHGRGVSQNVGKAIELYTKAATAGSAVAMYNLGHGYENGTGVDRDYPKAIHWYRQAAEAGDATSMYRLGMICEQGLGVPRDHARAVAWSKLAANLGDVDAKNWLVLHSP